MGQQSLESAITLYGYVDGSFNKLGQKLTQFGNQVATVGSTLNWLSIPLIAAGKQVYNLYEDYDTAKLWVQSLKNYSEDTMETIDGIARKYGQTTRYTATETMNAIGTITQAGLGLEDMEAVLPNVLNMAIAGNMEIADSADALISNLYATGTAFSDSASYVDLMAKTAAESNTSIEDLGESVERMGAVTRYFKGGNTEMFTWLGAMGNLGYQAGEAGTYLRNTLLALAAPTDKATEVMQALGASEDDLTAALEDVESVNAAETMRNIGLSMYDAKGNIRDMVDVLTDLDTITSSMTDQEKAEVLSSLFPKRTLGAATGLMELIDYAKQLNETLQDADGAAAQMAETRDSGIYGTKKRLISALQEVELKAGEVFGDDLTDIANNLRDKLLDIADTDPATIRKWVSTLETLAVAGPGLLIVGKALSGLGKLAMLAGTPGGAITLLALGIGLLYKNGLDYAEFLKDKSIEEHFGNLTIDAQELTNRISTLSSGFYAGMASVEEYTDSLTAAVGDFSSSSAAFSAKLMDASIFSYTLTPDDKTSLETLGGQMYDEVIKAIGAAQSKSNALQAFLFPDGTDDGTGGVGTLDSYFSGLYAQAESVRDKIKEKLSLATADGTITLAEESDIQAYINEYNRILAAISQGVAEGDAYAALAKMQRMGIDGYQDGMSEFNEKLQAMHDELFASIDEEAGSYIRAGKSQAEIDALYAAGEQKYSETSAPLRGKALAFSASAIQDAYANEFGLFRHMGDDGEYVDLLKALDNADIGKENLTETAAENTDFILFSASANEQGKRYASENGIELKTLGSVLNDLYASMTTQYTPEQLTTDIAALINAGQTVPEEMQEAYKTYANMANVWAAQGNLVPAIQLMDENDNLLWSILNGTYTPSITDTSGQTQPSVFAGYQESLLNADVDGDALAADAQEAGSTAVTQLQEAWGSPVLYAYIKTVGLSGAAAGGTAGSGLTAENDQEVSLPGFADGGRTDIASIFGEAGAEWAIPEEHTDRTADLLLSAASASGFTFGELIRRSGGLTADPGHTPSAPVFNPQIYVNGSAESVAEALQNAFEGFKEWYEDTRRDEERRAYA